jgi:hypothetical protein
MKRTVAIIALTIATVWFCFIGVAYRDWAFVCENTGSTKGYREWFFGSRTRHWNEPSSVEKFIQKKFPDQLEHRWASYAGTGFSITGGKRLHGHGRPGPIRKLRYDLDAWFARQTDTEKKAFYDLMRSTNTVAIDAKIKSISDDIYGPQ